MLQTLDTDLFYIGIQALVPQWVKFLNANDWSSAHVTCIYQSQN